MTKQTVLVVEDDLAIRQGVVDALEFQGYATLQAGNQEDARDLALHSEIDLILLDLVLPLAAKGSGAGQAADGLDILRQVRQIRPTLPVIILTARGQESDRVAGLQLGADDYVVKPFSVRELFARVQAVLRRSPQRPADLSRLIFPGGAVDLARQEARFDDGATQLLSEREMDLLRYLAAHAGRVISRQELLANVWRIDPRGLDTRTIDMLVVRLREKLRDDPHAPKMILTVRGKGYMYAQPPQAAPAPGGPGPGNVAANVPGSAAASLGNRT